MYDEGGREAGGGGRNAAKKRKWEMSRRQATAGSSRQGQQELETEELETQGGLCRRRQ